jgi:RNA polymerase sigma factor (TIGR02999 family)
MRRERPGNTLQTTALANEAYLRLVDAGGVNWKDRAHFFAVSTRIMRHILVDAARIRASAKRGDQMQKVAHSSSVNLDEIADVSSQRAHELIAVDDALTLFEQIDPREKLASSRRAFLALRKRSRFSKSHHKPVRTKPTARRPLRVGGER